MPGVAAPTPLSDAEFAAYQALVNRLSGIFLSESKRALLIGRLSRRLGELRLGSHGEYLARLHRDDAERVKMIDAICTNETQFFREPRQFEFLRTRVVPGWLSAAEAGRRPRTVRAWSAACSTGEEPYSVAMLLHELLPAGRGWTVDVLGTDISTRALVRARAAVWPMAQSSQIPLELRQSLMLRGTGPQQGRMRAGPDLRRLVRFERVNLNDPLRPVGGRFDLILCRNVLIYFGAETKVRVLRMLRDHLAPAGYLLLGHAESAIGLDARLVTAGPNVYSFAPGGSATRTGA